MCEDLKKWAPGVLSYVIVGPVKLTAGKDLGVEGPGPGRTWA